jgi:hypothetical protein
MKVVEVNVPQGTKFISDWVGFSLPTTSCIIDKTVCGCGLTEYCLNNTEPIILLSPRRVLLDNKAEQHNLSMKGRPLFYFKNEKEACLGYDEEPDTTMKIPPVEETGLSFIDLERELALKQLTGKEKKSLPVYLFQLKSDLRQWLIVNSNVPGFVPKIIVTYDSFKHVVDALGSDISKFTIVVDEFQSIFTDSTFKPEVELNVLEIMNTLPTNKFLFISATPMMERYLDKLDFFKDMTVYKFIWDKSLIEPVNLTRKLSESIRGDIMVIINNYLNGIYPTKITLDGVEHTSKEAVFFVNSVNIICDVLKKTKLSPDKVNILCANSDFNKKRLKKLGYSIGTVPVDKSLNKMFTFCTRTSYIGADFYSDNAMTFIFSDLNKQSLTIDISLDLPQIIGRQRSPENVFRNEIMFFYHKRTDGFYIDQESFDEHVREMQAQTQKIILNFNKIDPTLASEFMLTWTKSRRYKGDYASFSRKTNSVIENILVRLSEQRAWEITRPDYQENVFIRKVGPDPVNIPIEITSDVESITEFKKEFEKDGNFVRRMKLFYNFITKEPTIYQNYNSYFISFVPVEYRNCLNKLGINRIRSLKYKKNLLLNEINKIRLAESGVLKTRIQSEFQLNTFYSLTNIKDKLKKIYEEEGYDSTPKATDLQEYFEVEDQRLTNQSTKKRELGYLIKSLKP